MNPRTDVIGEDIETARMFGKRQISETGEQGMGLAKAGFWLGIAFTALSVLWVVFVFVLAASSGTTT